ncbi:type II toxin-antitoxin system RelE/ParE family toxin [Patescibacteria group bacterium]|nr:type II toxin-antitoxin system RelE/ParE family toxin [Patescibacteria group bacterium]
MKYTVYVEKKIQQKLKLLSPKNRKNIISKIKTLENFSGKTANVKKLKKPLHGYRLRVGDYRVLFIFNPDKKEIKIYTLDHRKDAYR